MQLEPRVRSVNEHLDANCLVPSGPQGNIYGYCPHHGAVYGIYCPVGAFPPHTQRATNIYSPEDKDPLYTDSTYIPQLLVKV